MSSATDVGDLLLDAATGPSLPSHFYFHVPFCASKCAYCDFASVAGADPQVVHAVFSGMRAEVVRWSAASLPGVIETLYIGGGTPSLHARHVARLLEWVRERLPVREGAEVTVEANPDSLDAEGLRALADAGATRVSVGVQSFDDQALSVLGRRHDARAARSACALVCEGGLALAVDLMCGLPGDDEASRTGWIASVEAAIGTGAEHVSVYPLQVEDGTLLAAEIRDGVRAEPDPDEAAERLVLAAKMLHDAGIERYEVANFAIPGSESRHNSAYWTGKSYAGVGPAAHGMLDVATARMLGFLPLGEGLGEVARVRYGQPAGLEEWLKGLAGEVETLTVEQARREDVMLGLRLVRGVPVTQTSAAGVAAALESLESQGLVEQFGPQASRRWRTTERGWLLGNEVFGRVWGP